MKRPQQNDSDIKISCYEQTSVATKQQLGDGICFYWKTFLSNWLISGIDLDSDVGTRQEPISTELSAGINLRKIRDKSQVNRCQTLKKPFQKLGVGFLKTFRKLKNK